MKNFLYLFLPFLFLLAKPLFAQSSTQFSGGLILETGIHHFIDKTAVGINICSPYLIQNSVALSGSYLFYNFRGIDITNTGFTRWVHYHSFRVGLQFLVNQEERFRPLSEIGWLGTFGKGTNEQTVFAQGIYFNFGFEFFWIPTWSSKLLIRSDAIMQDPPPVDERIQDEAFYLNGLSIGFVNQFYFP